MFAQKDIDFVHEKNQIRAREEGLTIVEGRLWYQNPEGLNGLGTFVSVATQDLRIIGGFSSLLHPRLLVRNQAT